MHDYYAMQPFRDSGNMVIIQTSLRVLFQREAVQRFLARVTLAADYKTFKNQEKTVHARNNSSDKLITRRNYCD